MTQKVKSYIAQTARPWRVSTTEALNIAIDFKGHVRFSDIIKIKDILAASDENIVIVGEHERENDNRLAVMNPIF